MKKIVSIFMSMVISLSIIAFPKNNIVKAEETEMRAAWVSTVFNIDWPSKASYNNAARQKSEYITLLEKLKGAGINTVMVQVRPESDALYRSKISPWSRYLTGIQGKDPGYDPLAFVIEESHKRGIDVHAWFNPYRASIYSDLNKTSQSNPMKQHPDWVIKYNNKWYYNPGLPQVTNYITDVVGEVVQNYDVDGVHFDDYFYPGGGFPDDETFKQYGSGGKDNWRRDNINKMLISVRNKVKSIKPEVQFGVSPAGIWRNSYNDPNGSNTSGGESYIKQFADTRYWIKNNLVDYVVPQVYWKIGHKRADYATLVRWWSDQVKGTKVKLYIGQGIYKHGQDVYGGENVAREIKQQILLNRKYPEIKGSVFFSAKDVVNLPQVYNDLKSLYTNSSVDTETIEPETKPEPNRRYPYQNQMMGSDRAQTAIQISKRGWPKGAKTVILVNGEELVTGVLAGPLAAANNAPILLSFRNKVDSSTIDEMKRLKAEKVIVVGDNESILRKDIENIEKNIPNIYVDRVYSSNAQGLSTKIADRLLREKKIDTVYLASEDAMVDILSIASKAGNQRNPILVCAKDSISYDNLNWIKENAIEKIYFIGGNKTLSDSLIKKIGDNVGMDLTANRVAGVNRVDTNSKVIEKFYNDDKFSWKAFVARASAPIDAITVSAFAQQTDSPVILAGNTVSAYQKKVLEPRSTSLLYKVGGQISENAYKQIYNLLEGVMK